MYIPLNLPEVEQLQSLTPQSSKSPSFIKSMTWVSVLQNSGQMR